MNTHKKMKNNWKQADGASDASWEKNEKCTNTHIKNTNINKKKVW